ncbi:hypothetical protein BCR41DRAFT_371568 [Lobosporangium transversale]|uniref:Uncharacterized protein n=1 Tax=Lobosporangium transversale TaxID=64571 RepID=A0A1Y2GPJ4_9FUNG|nr:hypothetical protein BCR41DRAFT_371568 [Lobosporangium transversale]ORZ13452.1 hypothetical protein BCR41DRAFT_371568 [Lobosporangium transversale]|eukprot:XP_021880533.1 hypothetical protein BCR41DRAFT_371568 [Lobosporangium transversale]
MTRVDPYPGPVTVQLNKLLAWLPFTYNRCGWQRRQSNAMNNDDSCGYQRRWDHQGPQGYYLAPPLPHELPDVNELEFEVKVLFASDEQCAAWMARAIGEEITTRIENEKRMGIRREQDGWQDREEWVWRDWLNEQDSTHERFLTSFQLFNPFSIQLILSLCSLKEFIAMEHKERVKAVGKFIDSKVLKIFNKAITTPLN